VSKYRLLFIMALSLALSVYLSTEGSSAPQVPIASYHTYLPVIREVATLISRTWLPIIHSAPISPISPVLIGP